MVVPSVADGRALDGLDADTRLVRGRGNDVCRRPAGGLLLKVLPPLLDIFDDLLSAVFRCRGRGLVVGLCDRYHDEECENGDEGSHVGFSGLDF